MNIPLIKAIVILPGTALVYIPALLVWLTQKTAFAASFPPGSTILWLAGLLFAAAGLLLVFWTMRLFAVAGGGGTPAPWEPVKNFIVLGPYRYVRHVPKTMIELEANPDYYRGKPRIERVILKFGGSRALIELLSSVHEPIKKQPTARKTGSSTPSIPTTRLRVR